MTPEQKKLSKLALEAKFNSALRAQGDARRARPAVQFGTYGRREFACVVTDPITGPIQATGPTPERAIATARRSWIEARQS